MARHHSTTSSTDSSGTSYPMILEHIFSYPGTYEIPLRTMYTLNCAPRAQPFRHSPTSSSSSDVSPISSQFGFQDSLTNQSFVENIMAQMQQLSNQQSSLPPSFITSFLRRCFPSELVYVDFPQALTGIDYLKDLETRRRREVQSVLRRLDISRATLELDVQFEQRFPGVAQWLMSIEDREHKLDVYYTQLYVGLRRWILINELSLLPFNRHNCIAMLNSLYPPTTAAPPTAKLTQEVMTKQRQGFFKYIQYVESYGPGVLSNLMQQGAAPCDDNGWPGVTRILGMYLQLANSIITECASISSISDLSTDKAIGVKHRSKTDSGVSLPAQDKRPSTSSSLTSDRAAAVESRQAANAAAEIPRPKTPSARGGSTLEKLARGLKSIGMSRVEATEIVPTEETQRLSPTKSKSLRKMRSLGNIGERKSMNSTSALDRETPAFNVQEMRQQRMKYEAANVHQQKFGTAISHEI